MLQLTQRWGVEDSNGFCGPEKPEGFRRVNRQGCRFSKNRGMAYAKKDDYDKAIMDYEAVLRIDPNDILARNNLEQARRAQGK